MVTNTTPLSPDQAEWEVESAIYVYAPDLIPKIKAQAGQPAPPAAVQAAPLGCRRTPTSGLGYRFLRSNHVGAVAQLVRAADS